MGNHHHHHVHVNTANQSTNDACPDKNENAHLPSHAVHMRRALQDCRQGVNELRRLLTTDENDCKLEADAYSGDNNSDGDTTPKQKQFDHCTTNRCSRWQKLFISAQSASDKYQEERDDGLQCIHQRISTCCNDVSKSHTKTRDGPIDVVYVHSDGSSWNTTHTHPTHAIHDHSNGTCCSCKTELANCSAINSTSKQEEHVDKPTSKLRAPCQFKQQYCVRNVPCIVRGLENSHFKDISSKWRGCNVRDEQQPDSCSQNCDHNLKSMQQQSRIESSHDKNIDNQCAINTDWFRNIIGDDTLVPVRIDPDNSKGIGESSDPNNTTEGLDDDGRAQECETLEMKLSEWLTNCRLVNQECNEGNENNFFGYLKDWHLVQYLTERQTKSTSENNNIVADLPTLPLYSTPPFFDRDLLNNFLQRYSDGGDFKFVYWGPRGSQTKLHSDVLHSFSWSYNVIGKKKWIFYVPVHYYQGEKNSKVGNSALAINSNNNCTSTAQSFEIIQHAGETIFVPSAWKHEVTNLVETISINHNWITSANIDQTWECILVEMSSIETELKEWGIVPEDDFEARENMLRGCIGLDVTSFFFMILVEMIELLRLLFHDENKKRLPNESDDAINNTRDINDDDMMFWDCAYSICRLRKVLNDMLGLSQNVMTNNNLNLVQRLMAVLDSQELGHEALMHASFIIDLSNLNQ